MAMANRERRFGKLLTAENNNLHQQPSLHPAKLPKRLNENSSPLDAPKRAKSIHNLLPENVVPIESSKFHLGKEQSHCKAPGAKAVSTAQAVSNKQTTAKGGDPTKSLESHVRRLDLDDSKSKQHSLQVPNVPTSPAKRITRSSSLKLAASKVSVVHDVDEKLVELRKTIDFGDPTTYYKGPENMPEDVEDYDKGQLLEIHSEPHYAHDVFLYYKSKETKYAIPRYMQNQSHINKNMRMVLVDWMVEVQESFELNHETLYLAVKLLDFYLSKKQVTKDRFQLLGATCLLAAAKYDERIPPAIEDFLYICDDAYTKRDLISMEIEVLKRVNFFLGYPLSYRFLRRFARCSNASMETLTLARYILETSLMDYDLIFELDSKLASAALLLALKMKDMNWVSFRCIRH